MIAEQDGFNLSLRCPIATRATHDGQFELLELHTSRHWDTADADRFIRENSFAFAFTSILGTNFVVVYTIFDPSSNPCYYKHATCVKLDKKHGIWYEYDSNFDHPINIQNVEEIRRKLSRTMSIKVFTWKAKMTTNDPKAELIPGISFNSIRRVCELEESSIKIQAK
jgi:hypothetical protein